MLRITINGQDYFKTSGQPARPWLYPSFKSVEPEVPEIYKKHIKEAFRKVVK